jgi:hypothetical protein
MTNIIDWSDEKPNRNDLGQYVQNVQNAPPKTKFVYHVGPSGTNSILKELFIDLSHKGQVHLVQKPLDQSKNRTFAYIAIKSSRNK